MIVVKLWGGMGNQMFQYAFGFVLAKRHNDELRFDVDWYAKQPTYTGKRKIEIDYNYNLSSFSAVHRPKSVEVWENRVISQATRRIPNFHCRTSENTVFVKERMRRYIADISYRPGMINYYDGYWLTGEYFKAFADEIRKEFTPKEFVLKEIEEKNAEIDSVNSVGIHIRRGDYLKRVNMPKGYNEEKLLDYYFRAIDLMKSEVKNPVFYVFSDDMDWCRETFGDKGRFEFLTRECENGAMVDLFGIAKCRHGIASPSTFSWWGNWLRENSEGSIVVIPKGQYANDRFAYDGWTVI